MSNDNPTNVQTDARPLAERAAEMPAQITDNTLLDEFLAAWVAILGIYNGKVSYAVRNLLVWVAENALKYGEHDLRRPAFVNLFCNRANRLKGKQKQRLQRIVKKTGAIPNPWFVLNAETGLTVADRITADLWKAIKSEISTAINGSGKVRAVPGKDDNGDPLPQVLCDLTELKWDGDEWNTRLDNMFTRHIPSASIPLETSNEEIDAAWMV